MKQEEKAMETQNNSSPGVLVADDDRVIRAVLTDMLEGQGYTVVQAENGQQAYSYLLQNPEGVEAALLDRNMPELDGLSVVRLLRQRPQLSSLPVVMVTGAGEPEQVQEGIRAGVFYYLTKPVDGAVVAAVTASALAENRRRKAFNRQLQGQQGGLALLRNAHFRLQTLQQAEQLSLLVAGLFPQPERALNGVAALLGNAVEHGRLRIGYTEKGRLLEENLWQEEIRMREKASEYDDKWVEVHVERLPPQSGSGPRTRLTITDPGPGFDWQGFLDLAPDRATLRHGRGIAQARAGCFDKLSYNKAGNTVQAESGTRPELEW